MAQDSCSNFEKLDVWNELLGFAHSVYTITRTFRMTSGLDGQPDAMRRAAVSISSNLAEGSSRSSRQDYSRFIEIANGSLYEVVSQSVISRRQCFLSEADYQKLYAAAEKESRMLSALRRSLEAP